VSDGAETVVAIDCPLADAPVRGRAALGWLISEAFVSAEPTDCLLGTKKGHAPGPNFMAAISGSHRGSVTVEQLGSLRANGSKWSSAERSTPAAATGRTDLPRLQGVL